MTALRQLFLTRTQLAILLVAIFSANLVETQWEEFAKTPRTYALGYRFAQTFQEIEGGFNFGGAERASRWMIGGYASAYFIVFPAMLIWGAIASWRRPGAGVLRVFSFSVALNYLLALPCYLFLPVPERWAYPAAKATLLSDLLSSRLIEVVRPISGIDNCFPSMHVALSLQMILLAYWRRSHWRHTILCLGLLVILSTFFLGIHWVPDIAMGLATAGISFGVAVRLNRSWYGEERPGGTRAFLERRRVAAEGRTSWRTAPPYAFARPLAGKVAFISYRRDVGSRLARVVQMELERRGYPCFLDVDDLGAEHFDDRLLREIEQAPNLIVVLAPRSLERCHEPEDWLRREITHALKHNRNIIPLLADGFQYPPTDALPPELRSLPRLNGVVYSHDYFNATFDKLEGFLRHE